MAVAKSEDALFFERKPRDPTISGNQPNGVRRRKSPSPAARLFGEQGPLGVQAFDVIERFLHPLADLLVDRNVPETLRAHQIFHGSL